MNSDQVKAIWSKNLPQLEKAFVEFAWEETPVYANYLAQTYRYITHSCKLLRYAADSTTNAALKACLLHHDAEEDGHENLALHDLSGLGFKLADIPELSITKEIYGTIYKQIDQYGPAAIVGYALALEGLSARRCPEIATRLVRHYGAAKSTLIKLHGEVDPDHIEDSFDVLEHFTDEEKNVVAQVILETIDRYGIFLRTMQGNVTSRRVAG